MARAQPFCVAGDSAMKKASRTGFRHVVKRAFRCTQAIEPSPEALIFKFRFYGKALKWNQRSLERGTAEKDEKIGGEKRPKKCAVKPNLTLVYVK